MVRVMGWWSLGMGRGMRGAPMTPSKSWTSAFLLPKTVLICDRSVLDNFIHDFMLCHEMVLLFLLLSVSNISSGIGTSRTVSSPSSRSKLGQSFFMIMRKSRAEQKKAERILIGKKRGEFRRREYWIVLYIYLGLLGFGWKQS